MRKSRPHISSHVPHIKSRPTYQVRMHQTRKGVCASESWLTHRINPLIRMRHVSHWKYVLSSLPLVEGENPTHTCNVRHDTHFSPESLPRLPFPLSFLRGLTIKGIPSGSVYRVAASLSRVAAPLSRVAAPLSRVAVSRSRVAASLSRFAASLLYVVACCGISLSCCGISLPCCGISLACCGISFVLRHLSLVFQPLLFMLWHLSRVAAFLYCVATSL